MNDAVTISHVNLVIGVVAMVITTIVTAASAAWWAAQLAMRTYDEKFKSVDRQILAIEDSQRERKSLFSEMEKALNGRVPTSQCVNDRSTCSHDRSQVMCMVTKQVEALTAAMNIQDEKRQQALQENNNMFSSIKSQVAVLTTVAEGLSRHSASLENLIRRRETSFRPPTEDDKIQ